MDDLELKFVHLRCDMLQVDIWYGSMQHDKHVHSLQHYNFSYTCAECVQSMNYMQMSPNVTAHCVACTNNIALYILSSNFCNYEYDLKINMWYIHVSLTPRY